MQLDHEEVARLCAEVGRYLRRAHRLQAATWYESQAAAFVRGNESEFQALAQAVHESISAGAGGPLGVIVPDALGNADAEATTNYKASLDRLYRLTTRSRWRDWVRSVTG